MSVLQNKTMWWNAFLLPPRRGIPNPKSLQLLLKKRSLDTTTASSATTIGGVGRSQRGGARIRIRPLCYHFTQSLVPVTAPTPPDWLTHWRWTDRQSHITIVAIVSTNYLRLGPDAEMLRLPALLKRGSSGVASGSFLLVSFALIDAAD